MVITVIGQIFEVKKSEIKDKKSGEVTYYSNVTVEQTMEDMNGDRVKKVEDYSLPIGKYDELRQSRDKYIVLYMQHISWGANATRQAGSMIMPIETLPYQIFDQNPLDQIDQTKQKKTA